MDKQNLLTIGNLSKQTGVHIKSLRYYEQLGILRPAHTDPDTGYRYYTLSQSPVVDAIRAQNVQAAAGVVADSVPEMEWKETEHKARALLRASELVEEGLE